MLLVGAFVIVVIGNAVGNTDFGVRAPVYALFSATALTVSLIRHKTLLGMALHQALLVLSTVWGVLAAWYWLQSSEPQEIWQILSLFLIGIAVATVWMVSFQSIRELVSAAPDDEREPLQ